MIKPGEDVTCIFSNPPFAGREADMKHLDRFATTKSEAGRSVQTPKCIPFVEHIIGLLKGGGIAALVLPNGIFSSQGHQFKKIRDLIWEKSEILAVIGLPHWVFFHTGCDVQGALLFLRRTDTPRPDYPVFIDWAENVGYDSAGRKTEANDLSAILERYQNRERPAENTFSAKELRQRGRIDPLFYKPGAHQQVSRPSGGNSKPLTDLLVPSTEVMRRRKGNTQKVRYVEVRDADKETGRILTSTEYEVQNLPHRARWVVRENMLLIPNHRNSIKSGRSVTLVPSEYDGAVVTSRFIVTRSTIPAVYLYHVLNMKIVQERMLTLVSGSSSTEIKFDQLAEIFVPLPEDDDFDLWLEKVNLLSSEIDDARTLMERKEVERQALLERLYQP